MEYQFCIDVNITRSETEVQEEKGDVSGRSHLQRGKYKHMKMRAKDIESLYIFSVQWRFNGISCFTYWVISE